MIKTPIFKIRAKKYKFCHFPPENIPVIPITIPYKAAYYIEDNKSYVIVSYKNDNDYMSQYLNIYQFKKGYWEYVRTEKKI